MRRYRWFAEAATTIAISALGVTASGAPGDRPVPTRTAPQADPAASVTPEQMKAWSLWRELPKRQAVLAAFPASGPDGAVRQLAAFGVLKHYIFVRWGRVPEYSETLGRPWMDYGGGMEVWREPSSSPAGRFVDDPQFRLSVLSRFLPPASVAAYQSAPGSRALLVGEVARREAAKRNLPRVFGIVLGNDLVEQMPNCENENKRPCFIELNHYARTATDTLMELRTANSAPWQPVVPGEALKFIGIATPDWVAPHAHMIGYRSVPRPPGSGGVEVVYMHFVEAVQVRALASHPDFRGDLLERFGRPGRERQIPFTNTNGKVWTVPELEWSPTRDGLHVKFVPDRNQEEGGAWGVLLIETDVAHQARRGYEDRQRQENLEERRREEDLEARRRRERPKI